MQDLVTSPISLQSDYLAQENGAVEGKRKIYAAKTDATGKVATWAKDAVNHRPQGLCCPFLLLPPPSSLTHVAVEVDAEAAQARNALDDLVAATNADALAAIKRTEPYPSRCPHLARLDASG